MIRGGKRPPKTKKIKSLDSPVAKYAGDFMNNKDLKEEWSLAFDNSNIFDMRGLKYNLYQCHIAVGENGGYIALTADKRVLTHSIPQNSEKIQKIAKIEKIPFFIFFDF